MDQNRWNGLFWRFLGPTKQKSTRSGFKYFLSLKTPKIAQNLANGLFWPFLDPNKTSYAPFQKHPIWLLKTVKKATFSNTTYFAYGNRQKGTFSKTPYLTYENRQKGTFSNTTDLTYENRKKGTFSKTPYLKYENRQKGADSKTPYLNYENRRKRHLFQKHPILLTKIVKKALVSKTP